MTAVGSGSNSKDAKNEIGFGRPTLLFIVCMMIPQQHSPDLFLPVFSRLSSDTVSSDIHLMIH